MLAVSSFRASEIREQRTTLSFRTWSNLRLSEENTNFLQASDNTFVAEMDHEKPEVVMPPIFEYASENTRSTLSPDFDFNLEPPIEEPPNADGHREHHGESLW
jgi:hypothetical protein